MAQTVLQTQIPNVPVKHGKVRDIYDLGDQLVIVASDRLSAFDVIMKTAVPYKGIVLTQISKFWFEFLADTVKNHMVTDQADQLPAPFNKHIDMLTGRVMLVKKTNVIPIECVVRGYLAGSGWKEYQKSQTVCGITLPEGLKQCDKLPEPIFTPSTKAEIGEHDENISFEKCVETIGSETAEYIKSKSLEIFAKASDYAESKGIILADTKFEWGMTDDGIILIDEVLTPDSSRFWPKDTYQPGKDQQSYDKQFVRNYLEEISFDKSGAGIELPEDICSKTTEKYIEAYQVLTGLKFDFS